MLLNLEVRAHSVFAVPTWLDRVERSMQAGEEAVTRCHTASGNRLISWDLF